MRRLLRPLFDGDPFGLDVVTLLLLVLVTVTGRNFGQREHVMLVLTFPCLVAASLGLAGHAVPEGASFGVGILAGMGLSLKPHFLVVWRAVDVLLRTRAGPHFVSPVRREKLALVAVLLTYGLSIVLVTAGVLPYGRGARGDVPLAPEGLPT